MNNTDINSNIDSFFSKTKDLFSDKYHELFESQRSCNKKLKPSRLPLSELLEILNKLNVTMDSVIENRVDYSVLASQYASHDLMPARYMEHSLLSSRFTGMYMINHVSSTQGEKAAKNLMQNFQLKGSQFQDPLQMNNVILSSDICEYIYKYYGSDEVFHMGQHFASLLKKTVHGQSLAQAPDLLSMFEYFCEEIAPKHVEKNFHWKVDGFGFDYLTVTGHPTEQFKDSFHAEIKKVPSLPYVHMGLMKSLPDIFGRFHTEVETLKSIQEGDDCNKFKLTYTPIKQLHPSLIQ